MSINFLLILSFHLRFFVKSKLSVFKNFQFKLSISDFQNSEHFIFRTSAKFNFRKFDRVGLRKNIADNVPRLGDSGATEAEMFQLKYKIKIEKQSVDLLDLAPLLPNRCCLQYFLFSRIANFVRSIRFREAEILRFIFLLNFVFRQFVVSKLFFSQVFCL